MELFKSEYMTTTVDGDRLSLVWQKPEPDDDHSVATATKVVAALDAYLATAPGASFRVLVDLIVVPKNYPRGTAAYGKWLFSNRARVRAVAFATKSLLARAGISATLLVPGLKAKGCSSLEDAQKFLASA